MQQFKIFHRTKFDYSSTVRLNTHIIRVRPREGHDLRIIESKLEITPCANVNWQRDGENNCIAYLTFDQQTGSLNIESETIVEKYDDEETVFNVADYATHFPFFYTVDDRATSSPYMNYIFSGRGDLTSTWLNKLWAHGETIETGTLLNRINQSIHDDLIYVRRDEEGIQHPDTTLDKRSGSCRDFAFLFMVAVQRLGFAARFISGYVYTGNIPSSLDATHAWVEVLIPGAGWIGFDPTFGVITGRNYITVTAARRPELTTPVEGGYFGLPESIMNVYVSISKQ